MLSSLDVVRSEVGGVRDVNTSTVSIKMIDGCQLTSQKSLEGQWCKLAKNAWSNNSKSNLVLSNIWINSEIIISIIW